MIKVLELLWRYHYGGGVVIKPKKPLEALLPPALFFLHPPQIVH